MTPDPVEQLLDAVADADGFAQAVEAHLDANPLPVDDAVLEATVDALERRLAVQPAPTARRWPWFVPVALAAAGALWMLQPGTPPAEPVVQLPAIEAVAMKDPVMSATVAEVPRSYDVFDVAGTHTLDGAQRELVVAKGARAWVSREGQTAVVFVERGAVESDGVSVGAHQWMLLHHDGERPLSVVFRDGDPTPALGEAWADSTVHAQLQTLRWRRVAEAGIAPSLQALLGALPEARAQVEACKEGCSRPLLHKAMSRLLVGEYVRTGHGDRSRALTLRAVAPEMLEPLQHLVWADPGNPEDWALGWFGLVERERLTKRAQEKASPATARFHSPEDPDAKPTRLTVRVTDPSGALVPTAMVRFPDEDVNHRVNVDTGEITEEILYFRDGSEMRFRRGQTLSFEVFAPGHRLQLVTTTLANRRRTRVDVVLVPAGFEDVGSAPGRAAIEAHDAWAEASAAYAKDPGDTTLAAVEEAAGQLTWRALEWRRKGGGEQAVELCRMASETRKACD